MKIDKEQIISGTVFFVVIGIILYLGWLGKKDLNEDIKENKIISVAYIYDFKSNRSFNYYYYNVIVNGVTISSFENLNNFERESCIGKYYRVIYSSKNPKHSKIFLDKEITDLTEIKKAGFNQTNL